jgi:hypothetical protein
MRKHVLKIVLVGALLASPVMAQLPLEADMCELERKPRVLPSYESMSSAVQRAIDEYIQEQKALKAVSVTSQVLRWVPLIANIIGGYIAYKLSFNFPKDMEEVPGGMDMPL